GLVTTGDDLRITLRRVGGKYSLIVENLTKHRSSTLAIAHPTFLDGARDLYVGLFGANTQSDVRKTLTIQRFDVRVWTVSPVKPAAPDHPDPPARCPQRRRPDAHPTPDPHRETHRWPCDASS